MNPETHDMDSEDLFVAALGVFNRALDAHHGSTPCEQILAECTERHQGRFLDVQLYDDDPCEPIARLAIRFRHGLFEPVSADELVDGPTWKISVEKLEEIVADGDHYVSNPEKLPWA